MFVMPPVMALKCLVVALRGFLVIEVAYTKRKRSNMLLLLFGGTRHNVPSPILVYTGTLVSFVSQ